MSLETARKVLKAELEAIEGLLERLDGRFEQKRRVILSAAKNLGVEMLLPLGRDQHDKLGSVSGLSFRAQRGICL